MWSKKEILIFLTGAQTFHTLIHIIMSFSGTLPINFFFINWSFQLNLIGIIINALVTMALFWWVSKLR